MVARASKRPPRRIAHGVAVALACGACHSEPPPDPLFVEQFDTVLDTLTSQYWQEDGDWIGDLQGDATAFAPQALYDLDDPQLAQMATATVDHELALLIDSGAAPSMEILIGAPALAEGYRRTGQTTYRSFYLAGLIFGTSLIVDDPSTFQAYVGDLATVYGSAAYLNFDGYALSEEEEFLDNGLELIARAQQDTWDPELGLYGWSLVADWPQATMIMALVAAYAATQDASHLQRAQAVFDAMNSCCWDPARGGYYGRPGLDAKGLSGNNNMAWAALDLFAATGDRLYLDRARETITWILSSDIYNEDDHLLHHHWSGAGAIEPGQAKTFCTGCNFQTLVNIGRLNQLQGSPWPPPRP